MSEYFCKGCGWHVCKCKSVSRKTPSVDTSAIVPNLVSVPTVKKVDDGVTAARSLSTKTFCSIAKDGIHHQIKILDDQAWWCTICGLGGLEPSERKSWN